MNLNIRCKLGHSNVCEDNPHKLSQFFKGKLHLLFPSHLSVVMLPL